MKIEDLEYIGKVYDFNHRRFEDYNIFNNSRVLRGIAMWIVANKRKKKSKNDKYLLERYRTPEDVIQLCFFDLCGRCEYEFIVKDGEIVGSLWDNVEGEKSDVYKYYVLPNSQMLMDMINKVSLTSAQRWLREDRKCRSRKTL